MSSWSGLLARLLAGTSVTAADTQWAMAEVMAGQATPAQVAGLVVALRMKGETAEEVRGIADAMLAVAGKVDVAGPVVDTCGTGGDRAHTVNVSTMAALVVAAAGATVVKHGNRAASSACGAADLLEELGVAIDLGPAEVTACVRELGIGFCFAPIFHPAMRHAAAARRELGVPTVFNVLGPLTNPAGARYQAVGVYDPRMAPVVAEVLAARGSSALVFRGDDGLDELTVTTTSQVWAVHEGTVRHSVLDPAALGVALAEPGALTGADAAYNAGVAQRLLAGETGPVRDAVILNAAAALAASAPSAAPLYDRLAPAMETAGAAIDRGAAARLLDRWVELSGRLRASSAS